MWNTKNWKGAIATVSLITMSTTGALAEAESSDPIRFAMNDWSGQLINSRVMGSILEEAGYNVEYGHTTGKSLAFAYVDSDRMGAENLEVGLLGQNHKVRGLSTSVHDPENALLKR